MCPGASSREPTGARRRAARAADCSLRTWTVGRDYSVADTESWSFSNSESHGISQGESTFWEVSSTQSTSYDFGAELPKMFGVFYRQTSRIMYPGVIVVFNLCGAPRIAAEAPFTDYTWAVSMSQGPDCPPFPKSSLPEAQCIIAPCAASGP